MKRRKIMMFVKKVGKRSGSPSQIVSVLLLLMVGIVILAVYSPSRGGCFNDPSSVHQLPGNLQHDFQITLDSMRNRYGFPGATAAYLGKDGILKTAATGHADVETGTSMTPESRMLTASIGKTFVAATAVSLSKEGTLNLDVPNSPLVR